MSFFFDQAHPLLNDQIWIRRLHQMRELGVGDIDQTIHDKVEGCGAVFHVELPEPQCKTLDEPLSRPKSLVMVVLVVWLATEA